METNQIPTQPQAPTPPPTGSSSHNRIAILAYLGILILVPFLTEAKNDPFVKFHIKQGLVLIIFELGALFLVQFLWFIAPVIWLFNLAMTAIGIVNAASGKMKELPVIGGIARNFNF
ncbi:MAG: hypothetical protein HYT21_01765 [Candidatus Nealsonbacteria bacterium]|nr:hypothetical protein [Candidatus Nealsonbacteria bacterium]